MSPPSRIQNTVDPTTPLDFDFASLIAHERAIHRSLTSFGLALAFITITLVVLAIR